MAKEAAFKSDISEEEIQAEMDAMRGSANFSGPFGAMNALYCVDRDHWHYRWVNADLKQDRARMLTQKYEPVLDDEGNQVMTVSRGGSTLVLLRQPTKSHIAAQRLLEERNLMIDKKMDIPAGGEIFGSVTYKDIETKIRLKKGE